MSSNFPITAKGQALVANVTPARLSLGAASQFACDIGISNPGNSTVYVLAGDASVTADALCMPIGPAQFVIYRKGIAPYLSAYCPDGAANLVVFVGEGE